MVRTGVKRRWSFKVAAIVGFAGFSSCVGALDNTLLSPDVLGDIDTLVATEMQNNSVPGISVAIATDKKLVWAKGYGLADIENNVPVSNETVFRTASIDKWMTAVATLKLQEEGKLALGDEARKHCPIYPKKRWPLKVRHLLNNSGGVRHYWGTNGEPVDTPEQRADLEQRELQERLGEFRHYTDAITPVEVFKDDPLLFEPGTKYKYTSHGYRLLGCVLAGASGEAYRDLMQRLIFTPSGMTQTTPDNAYALIPYRVRGYTIGDGGAVEHADFRDVSENLPAGGHLSTPSDIVRFVAYYTWGDLIRDESRESALKRPAFSAEKDSSYYGFGLRVTDHKDGPLAGYRTLSHNGSQAGTRTRAAVIPEKGIAVVVFMNNDEPHAGPLTTAIMARLLE